MGVQRKRRRREERLEEEEQAREPAEENVLEKERPRITGYSMSGQDESWSINFAKKEFSQAPPPERPTGR